MINDIAFKKARIAPTPSGYLHLGNVLSFAVTAALAARAGAKLFLRIDDVDRERTNKLYVQDIFDTLNFLEIPWDEGPGDMQQFDAEYSQTHRLPLYAAALDQLKASGHIFACTCSRTEVRARNADNRYTGTCRERNLSCDTANVSWRLRTDLDKPLALRNIHGNNIATTLPPIMTDFAVRKRDGFPGYQLTSLIDDMHFGVDMVVRGEDLWASTLAQQYLALELDMPAFSNVLFYHHPLLLDENGLKLSKSLGATSVQYFRKQHKKPADIYALIAQILGVEAATGSWSGLVALLGTRLGLAG
jgi:glutamyl/glutaminyl-tRNA synthetase